MTPNERRPGVGTGAAKTIAGSEVTSNCTGTYDNYPVTASFVIDLRDWDTEWPETSPVRLALADLERLPRGAHVRLVIGRTWFSRYYIYGLTVSHVAITVEGNDVTRIRSWVQGLREARA